MRHIVLRRMSAATLAVMAAAFLVIFGLSGTESIHAQSNSTSATNSGGCDQYDSFCNYCMNNPGSDLCATGANPSMNAIGGRSQMSMGSSASMGTDSSMSMGSGSMGSGYSMAPAMSMMGISMEGSNMAGLTWVWCGAGWTVMSSVGGIPC